MLKTRPPFPVCRTGLQAPLNAREAITKEVTPMPPQHSPGLLAWLKGPPLSIFLAIARNPGLGPSALGSLSGWGRGATYDALRRLASVGWIERRYRGCWVLTDTGRIALWSLAGDLDTPPPPRRRRPDRAYHSGRQHPCSLPASTELPPSDISRVFPEISPSGTDEGPPPPKYRHRYHDITRRAARHPSRRPNPRKYAQHHAPGPAAPP